MTGAPDDPERSARAWRAQRALACLVAACLFMEFLDATIVITGIPAIARALDVSEAAAALVITAYLVTVAVGIPVSAWMAGRFGARRVFLSAIAVFTAASLGCAASASFGELVAFRVGQGIGGAMLVPIGRIVVLSGARKSELVALTSYLVWPALFAPIVAPLAGGLITTYAGWRWMFLINVPLGVVAFAVAWRIVPPDRGRRDLPLDRIGLVLSALGCGALAWTTHIASSRDPQWPAVAAGGVTSLVALALAVRHLRATPYPLIDLSTLRVRTYALCLAGGAWSILVLAAIPFVLPILFQTRFGWSPVRSGAVILFLFLGNLAAKPFTSLVYRRYGFRRVLLGATAGIVVTTLALASLSATTSLWSLIGILVLCGVARAFAMTGFMTLMLSDVDGAQRSHAMTLQSVMFQLFSGLGVVAGTLALRAGDRMAFVLLAGVAVGALATALRLTPGAGMTLLTPRGLPRSDRPDPHEPRVSSGP